MKVAYKPLENGDPIETVVAGITFRAGELVDVPEDASVETLERLPAGKTSEGETTFKSKEGHRSVIEMLKSNPYFEVEGKSVAKAKPGRPAQPKTPSEYRSYAQEWFKTTQSSDDLAKRWEKEEVLRARIGIPDEGEDCRFLTPFFERRMDEIKSAEKAKD